MTPGTLKGFYEAIQEFGTMPWADIIQPAIDFAEEGFTISPAIDEFWERSGRHGKISMNEKLRQNEMSRKIFFALPEFLYFFYRLKRGCFKN